MNISIFGLGYVGTVSFGCLVRDGHDVIGVDIDQSKLDLINNGVSPIVEEGVPELIAALNKEGGGDILVVVGGIIPPSDYEVLYDAGVAGIFGPGTPVTESANQVLNALDQRG